MRWLRHLKGKQGYKVYNRGVYKFSDRYSLLSTNKMNNTGLPFTKTKKCKKIRLFWFIKFMVDFTSHA